MNATFDDPMVVLNYLVGRRLTTPEILEAFGISRATYYKLVQDGKLNDATRLIRAARVLHLNPLDVLVRCGHITEREVLTFQPD